MIRRCYACESEPHRACVNFACPVMRMSHYIRPVELAVLRRRLSRPDDLTDPTLAGSDCRSPVRTMRRKI